MGVVDTDDELMWTDDHNPPMPTTQWKPGQTIEYTRTVFVPVLPVRRRCVDPHGAVLADQPEAAAAAGEDAGQRAYKVAKLQLLPQTENVFTVFKDGWHPAETPPNNASVEWQWTKKEATLAFRNPKKDSVFYLDAGQSGQRRSRGAAGPGEARRPGRRRVHARARRAASAQDSAAGGAARRRGHGRTADRRSTRRSCRRCCPASTSKDPRELGVRVFHAFVDAEEIAMNRCARPSVVDRRCRPGRARWPSPARAELVFFVDGPHAVGQEPSRRRATRWC